MTLMRAFRMGGLSSLLAERNAPLYRTSPHWGIHAVAFVSVLIYAAGRFVLPREIVRLAELMTLLALVVSLPYVLRARVNIWLVGLLLALVGWMLFVDHSFSEAPASQNVARFERVYARQFLFLLAGWWLAGRAGLARILLLGGLVGIAAALILQSTGGDWSAALAGKREDFGLHNAQHTALYVTSALLALPALAMPIRNFRRPFVRALAGGALIALAGGCLLILAATQTRQTWVAVIPALAVAFAAFRLAIGGGLPRPRPAMLAGLLALLVVLLVASPWEGAWERTQSEWGRVEDMLAGTPNPESSSTTIRLAQWRFAAGQIAERPLIGHGGGATGYLLQHSSVPEFAREDYGHVHNGYLELLVQYGLIGFGLWLAAMAILIRQITSAMRAHALDAGFAAFAASWPVYFLIVNVFESFTRFDSSTYVMFVFGGAIYGATLRMPDSGTQGV